MLRFLTSLSFLYLLSILLLLLYGFLYYRDFTVGRRPRKLFPLVFTVISIACFLFLWINIHAPLQLKTFSNLDHHFIQHDGFLVNTSIELGRSDTALDQNRSFNSFVLTKKEHNVQLFSSYSEEPAYVNGGDNYHLLSITYPAVAHRLSFSIGALTIRVTPLEDNNCELRIGEWSVVVQPALRKGASLWTVFRSDTSFVNSPYYENETMQAALRQVFLLRDHLTRKGGTELRFFLSGRLFHEVTRVQYDDREVLPKEQQFEASLPDGSQFAWGIGFLDNNRNQYRVQYTGRDSFSVLNRYPVSYPLTEEQRDDWSQHNVRKFLVSGTRDLLHLPPVFTEGFSFSLPDEGEANGFAPVLLNYRKGAQDDSLRLEAVPLAGTATPVATPSSRLLLPARSHAYTWIFSIRNTYNWDFGASHWSPAAWQGLLFGSLGIFFLLVFLTSVIKRGEEQNWVWQVLSCLLIVLLSTRFLLYWRYKSFPPYEGMDLPSQQQLEHFGNFGIIVFATVALAIIFGFGAIRAIVGMVWKKNGSDSIALTPASTRLVKRFPLLSKWSAKIKFFGAWLLLLLVFGAYAAFNHFDPGTCRHLAIVAVLAYFVFLFISYRYSPLVKASAESWWNIGTGRPVEVIVSNPVKVLLSVSLLALFVFIDIGFAIVFLNFLLFNEAFLCINYAMAGLSAGNKRNAGLFGLLGTCYLSFFVLNLLYAPYIFKFLLALPDAAFITGYVFFAGGLSWMVTRLLRGLSLRRRRGSGMMMAAGLFLIAFLFFPKQRILEKAAMTRYRIDVLTAPAGEAILSAYNEGKTYEPVIRAAQNQWFINTFIDEQNNPAVQSTGFHLLPHAPQNKGAKYNAQATDLVASRFLIAEHGKWSVLLYVFLLLLPVVMLASFYKLYPDFTNRTNGNYPGITTGFSILNYLLITAMMVILAATGRYIFFGQDLPFGSILSKQSILFPCILLLTTAYLFRRMPLEHYANRGKAVPGLIVFVLVAISLFLVRPSFNRNKEFGVAGLATQLDGYVQSRLQPLLDYFDTAKLVRKPNLATRDRLFTDSLKKLIAQGSFDGDNGFFSGQARAYAYSGLSRHLDQHNLLFLDLNSGHPQLSVNENYFRVEPPPHLQSLWCGNVYGDTTEYLIDCWTPAKRSLFSKRVNVFDGGVTTLPAGWALHIPVVPNNAARAFLVNESSTPREWKTDDENGRLGPGDSIRLRNPARMLLTGPSSAEEMILTVSPDAFMKNYYVNGSRFYLYPMESRFNWVRNFAEAVSPGYVRSGEMQRNAFLSLDAELMDSLSTDIRQMMESDTSYQRNAEYGICIADGNGRVIALTDFIKGVQRPDPNDKAGFLKKISGENGIVSQSVLRKQVGNLNFLRMNPGPGSTFKPVAFAAVASQLSLDWDDFAVEGFSEKQHYFAGEKVPEYDFEKNNGRINRVSDYFRFSDNYYHSNVLLLGSYPKQPLDRLLHDHFQAQSPGAGLHWPWFSYKGTNYWMNGFRNWPGYDGGRANFGLDSSFSSIGLLANFGIYTREADKSFDPFLAAYDSALFSGGDQKSGFILPEYGLFDQYGEQVNHHVPYDLFTSCFRGHVKGSSQVLVAPAKMVEAYGKLITQSRNYSLTLNPYATPAAFSPFYVDDLIPYNNYLSLIREDVFAGMHEVLFAGTAAALGSKLKNGAPYYYYAKTGTTGDDASRNKSKLLAIIISAKDVTSPGFNFRDNRFYTVYFTSQNGPAKQNEAFQAAIIRMIQSSHVFNKYMVRGK